MTILDERREADSPSIDSAGVRRIVTSPTASWRFASRLARREVRRRPGRTMLVMLLVIIPVIGMTLASIAYRTSLASRDALADRQYGTADLVLRPMPPNVVGGDPVAPVLGPDSPALPEGSRATDYVQSWTPMSIEVDDVVVTRGVLFTDVDLTDPITAPTVEVTDGRAPNQAGEVLLSESAASRFGVELDDEVRFVRPAFDATIVGIGRDADSFGNDLVVAPAFDRSLFRDGAVSVETLVDLPDSFSDVRAQDLAADFRAAGVSAIEADAFVYFEQGQTGRELAWGWVAGVVSLVVVGIVIAAAFATSARRQLVTIGQLSANGAPERLVRRTMGLQGWWTGLFGAVAGVAAATAFAVIAQQAGWVERVVRSRVDSLSIVPLDLIVIVATATAAATIAALVPARSAARIPVLSALAGRRPVSTPPSWMGPVGAAAFLVGLFLLGGAATIENGGDFAAMLALGGSLLVLAGIVCASPLIVAAVGDVGSRAGGVIRLASRSLGRSRSRSAAVLTAIAVVGALSTVGATVARADATRDRFEPDLARIDLFFSENHHDPTFEQVAASGDPTAIYDPPPVLAPEVPVDIRTGIDAILPEAVWIPVTQTVVDPPPFLVATGQQLPRRGCDRDVRCIGRATVADATLTDRLTLPDGITRLLDEDGVAVLSPYYGDPLAIDTPAGLIDIDASASLEALGFDRPPETREEQRRAEEVRRSVGYSADVLVSPEFVEENGFETGVFGYRIENPVDISAAQREALRDLRSGFFGPGAFVDEATAPGFESLIERADAGEWYPSADSPRSGPPAGLIQLAVIVASLLLVLGVVAVGLSLAAAESRDERDVLHAVGASPSTLRRVSAAKAWVLTTGAAVVAVPAGYLTILVITRVNDDRAPFPFVVAAALLVAIPLVAAAATMGVSAAAQRFRPVSYSTLAAD